MATLTLIASAGKNKHGHKLVIVRCSCGSPDFACRESQFESGHTTSCGCTRRSRKLNPKPASEAVAESVAKAVNSFDHLIALKDAAALAAENRASALERTLAAQEHTDLDTHKAWNGEARQRFDVRVWVRVSQNEQQEEVLPGAQSDASRYKAQYRHGSKEAKRGTVSIRALYIDEDGRVVRKSEETFEDYPKPSELQRNLHATVRQVTAGEVYLAEKGTQRRPTKHPNRFIGHIDTTRWKEKA